jgi:glycosyltransferase involved in cell wall biosynthesis
VPSSSPLFSIVTVTLNPGSLLAETAASIHTQTFRNFEYIVKDGESMDESIEALRATYPDVQVVVQKDSGIYDAMNQALDLCTGKYVLFLNAGDTLHGPDVLARLAEVCAGEDGPDLVYTDYFATDWEEVVGVPQQVTPAFLYRVTLCHQTCYIRRDWYERLGKFDTGLRVAADYDFLIRLIVGSGAYAQYMPIVSATFLGGGFSARPDIYECVQREVKTVRRRHYHPILRALYGAMEALTLAGLRHAIFRVGALQGLRKPYRRLVKWIYTLLGSSRKP